MKQLKNITLEISAKAFKDNSVRTMEEVCARMFRQWKNMTDSAERISVLLWISDGSEILEYKGKRNESFEWAYWQGVANVRVKSEMQNGARPTIHQVPWKYIENPPVLTYAWLKKLVKTLKRIGREESGKVVRGGATFDPGPEFAVSEFKYKKHPEICGGNTMGNKSFVTCNTSLHADRGKYAGFPDGIPGGTPFGAFLGKQVKHFVKDMGFDYIWFSNGFGFGLEAWGYKGSLFDGERFMPEKARTISEDILNFWECFARECPNLPIETRGSNFSAGLEICKDGVPIRDIYEKFKPIPPVNSPWAALNDDFGTEIAGWMSHIAELPSNYYQYRFYTHDPWFLNSPWLDRYQREAHDIYMLLGVSRINGEGDVENPSSIAFLTVDDSWGNMPEKVPNEVIPHVLCAYNDRPDRPGIITLVYPFDEYSEVLKNERGEPGKIFAEEWFLKEAINAGLPLNTVISSANFIRLVENGHEHKLAGGAVIMPTSAAKGRLLKAVKSYARKGGNVIFYGTLNGADEELLDLIGAEAVGNEIAGELKCEIKAGLDIARTDAGARKIYHSANISAGGIREVLVPGKNKHFRTKALACVGRGNEKRVIGLVRTRNTSRSGKIIWLRPVNSVKDEWFSPCDAGTFFNAGNLTRYALEEIGIRIAFEKHFFSQKNPMLVITRHKNGFFYSGYCPDTTVRQSFRMPWGAPVFTGMEAEVSDGCGVYQFPKSWHKECRIFMEQKENGIISVREGTALYPAFKRRIKLQGLKKADVTFFPEAGFEQNTEISLGAGYLKGERLKTKLSKTVEGDLIKINKISGNLLISW